MTSHWLPISVLNCWMHAFHMHKDIPLGVATQTRLHDGRFRGWLSMVVFHAAVCAPTAVGPAQCCRLFYTPSKPEHRLCCWDSQAVCVGAPGGEPQRTHLLLGSLSPDGRSLGHLRKSSCSAGGTIIPLPPIHAVEEVRSWAGSQIPPRA